jgi:hypothetical protein
MNAVKWTWALFVVASIFVIIRIAVWIFPSAALEHSTAVTEAVKEAGMEETAEAPLADVVERTPEPESMPEPAPEPEPVWPDESKEQSDWPPALGEELDLMGLSLSESAPAPEEFHLRNTRWGMPLEEVRASEGEAPVRETDRGLLYVTTTLEMPTLLTYAFRQGRLVRARLSFSDPTGEFIPPLSVAQAQRRFLFLREQLRARYGEPVLQVTHVPRNVSDHQRSLLKQEELSAQYEREIAEAQARLDNQRERLNTRFQHWSNKDEMRARGLAPIDRDIRELQRWKEQALAQAAESRQNIQANQRADADNPLVATLAARWPDAKELHDVELRLDMRSTEPHLDIRYTGRPVLPEAGAMNEL